MVLRTSSQAFLLHARGFCMKLNVYRPEEILVTLVIEYYDILEVFGSVPKFIGYDERLVLDVRFNTRTSDIEILSTRTEWFAEAEESFVRRNIPVTGDIQGTFLQPLATRMSEGIRLALAKQSNCVIC